MRHNSPSVGAVSIGAIRRLSRNRFVRNVAAMASGTAAAQVIALLLTPVVTRLYGPAAFGQLGVFNSLVALLGPAAALTYPIAIVLPERQGDARQLARLSLLIAALVSLACGLLLLVFQPAIVRAFDLAQVAPYLFLLPFVLFTSAAQQVAQQWLIRERRFGAIARVNVAQSLFTHGSQAAAGLLQPVGAVLIWLASIGRLLHALLLGAAGRGGFLRAPLSGRPGAVTPMRVIARRYWDFPVLRAPEVLISAASVSVPVIMLSAFYGATVAGYFTLCQTILALPTRLIGNSVGAVFYPQIASDAAAGKPIFGAIRRASLGLVAVGIWPFLLVLAFGPFLFGLVMGSEWLTAGEYARWVALGAFLNLVNRPAAQAMPVIHAQGVHLLFSVAALIVRISALLGGYLLFGSALASVALYGAADLLFYLVRLLLILRLARRFDRARGARG